jgi:23S rRNA U2552 (ribose-2'-O)-methylase RlmE/FtsJ
VLIDLCAAPGSWLQVAEKFMPVNKMIVGVDLVPIRPIRNVITLTEDITTEKCKHALKKVLGNLRADVYVVVTHQIQYTHSLSSILSSICEKDEKNFLNDCEMCVEFYTTDLPKWVHPGHTMRTHNQNLSSWLSNLQQNFFEQEVC